MSNAQATRNARNNVPDANVFSFLGHYAGRILFVAAVLVLFAMDFSPHFTGQRTVIRDIPACQTQHGIDALVQASSAESIAGYFFAGLRNRCRSLDAGSKVFLLDTSGLFWWRATVRLPDGKVLYTDTSALD